MRIWVLILSVISILNRRWVLGPLAAERERGRRREKGARLSLLLGVRLFYRARLPGGGVGCGLRARPSLAAGMAAGFLVLVRSLSFRAYAYASLRVLPPHRP